VADVNIVVSVYTINGNAEATSFYGPNSLYVASANAAFLFNS
jgi:hypothetical protein